RGSPRETIAPPKGGAFLFVAVRYADRPTSPDKLVLAAQTSSLPPVVISGSFSPVRGERARVRVLGYPSRESHDTRRQRALDPRRAGNADGGAPSAVLAAAGGGRGAGPSGRSSPTRPAAGREPGGLPRLRRAGRAARPALSAPRSLALLRAERGGGTALRLPRLEVRLRGALPGNADGTVRELRARRACEGVSVRRAKRCRLGLPRSR